MAHTIDRISRSRNEARLWGGPDALDELITTTHVVMTLMASGYQPSSALLAPAFDYLFGLDTSRNSTFYWRSGPLLNVPGYEATVEHDMRYIARLRERAGGNPHYPAPFFLLKLARFSDSKLHGVNVDEVVDWILGEWTETDCWYGRTSITSMGLALLADLVDVPPRIIARSTEFLLESCHSDKQGRYCFSDNLIDDCFTIYNLYERHDSLQVLPPELFESLARCADGILNSQGDDYLWHSSPPFGGTVDSPLYGTAVAVRALIAQQLATSGTFEIELALALLDIVKGAPVTAPKLTPFWGELALEESGVCFIIMPFSPSRRTEIYQRYVKAPLETSLGLRCIRADDIYRSREIMRDVWEHINSATLIVADLSDRNPNVFYELGMAHVLGKEVVLIAESMDDVPFDLRSVRVLIYGDTPTTWERLARDIVEYARFKVSQ